MIGASTGPGRLLFESLRDDGRQVLGIARNQRDVRTSSTAMFHMLDAMASANVAELISPGDAVVHCSRPEILTGLIRTGVPVDRLIALGSTRIYTRFADDKCARLTEMTHTISMSDVPATIIHPTMIYGAPGLNNIERVQAYARRSPIIPLPAGGRTLIQPIHAEDVVAGIKACLADDETIGRTIVAPGPAPMTYRDFISCCIAHTGAKCRVVSLPYPLLVILGFMTPAIPFVPTVSHDEIRRLLEDKSFSVDEFAALIKCAPRTFQPGTS